MKSAHCSAVPRDASSPIFSRGPEEGPSSVIHIHGVACRNKDNSTASRASYRTKDATSCLNRRFFQFRSAFSPLPSFGLLETRSLQYLRFLFYVHSSLHSLIIRSISIYEYSSMIPTISFPFLFTT